MAWTDKDPAPIWFFLGAVARMGALLALLMEFMVEVPLRPFGASGLPGMLFLVLLASRAQTSVATVSREAAPSLDTDLPVVEDARVHSQS